jgi:proteasome accessory factor B
MAAPDRIHRLFLLVSRLQSGRIHSARELSVILGVSYWTIVRDLKLLQRSGIPVLFDKARKGYAITGASLLPPTQLTVEEALAILTLSQGMGSKKNGIPFLEAAESAGLKFLSSIPGEMRSELTETISGISFKADPHHPLTGKQGHYENIQAGMRETRKVRILYWSVFERKEIATLLSPYTLLYSNRSWYAIGRSSFHRSIRTFHIGRIRSSELTEERFDKPRRFSVDQYFGDAWHMIREPKERHTIVIRFAPLVAANVAEVIWHATQKVSYLRDGSIEFRVNVEGLREISWWILSYGDQAEVLEPPQLRTMISEHVARLATTYSAELADRDTNGDGAARRSESAR